MLGWTIFRLDSTIFKVLPWNIPSPHTSSPDMKMGLFRYHLRHMNCVAILFQISNCITRNQSSRIQVISWQPDIYIYLLSAVLGSLMWSYVIITWRVSCLHQWSYLFRNLKVRFSIWIIVVTFCVNDKIQLKLGLLGFYSNLKSITTETKIPTLKNLL